ncbi:MAG: hypothetical protein QXD03_02510 [Candidatus Anstonellales archaeon]
MRKSLSVLLLMFCMIFSLNSIVYGASDNDKVKTVESFIKQNCVVNGDSIDFKVSALSIYVRTEPDETYNNPVDLGDGNVVYYSSGSVNNIYGLATKFNSKANISNKVNDVTGDIGMEANTKAAGVMLSGFKPIVELIIGVILVLVIFGMGIYTANDIAYIAFPLFRNKMEEVKADGNRLLTKKDSNGDVQLRWVTEEAQYAVKEGTLEGGKNPWRIYLGKRIVSYIFLGISIYILFGHISLITDIAIRVVSGIMEVLNQLAN